MVFSNNFRRLLVKSSKNAVLALILAKVFYVQLPTNVDNFCVMYILSLYWKLQGWKNDVMIRFGYKRMVDCVRSGEF